VHQFFKCFLDSVPGFCTADRNISTSSAYTFNPFKVLEIHLLNLFFFFRQDERSGRERRGRGGERKEDEGRGGERREDEGRGGDRRGEEGRV